MNVWTFFLPSLVERREDLELNLEFELSRFAQENGATVRFNKEARERYLTFATAPSAVWSGNFRELSASLTRMATLADGGRLTLDVVESEIARLNALWQVNSESPHQPSAQIPGSLWLGRTIPRGTPQ